MFHGLFGAGFGCLLGGKRRALARTPEIARDSRRRRPRDGIAILIGDCDNRIVESCLNVSNTLRDILSVPSPCTTGGSTCSQK